VSLFAWRRICALYRRPATGPVRQLVTSEVFIGAIFYANIGRLDTTFALNVSSFESYTT
jgi:hypothetical protein